MTSGNILKGTLIFLFAALLVAAKARAADIIIYDGSIHGMAGIWNKGSRVLKNGKKFGPMSPILISQDAYDVSKNLAITEKFFRERFDIDSYDNRGAPIEAIVRVGRMGVGSWHMDFLNSRRNATWNKQKKLFIFGAGDEETLSGYPKALDVIAHEYTHAIDSSSARLRNAGQSGALKEHIADMFGQMVQVANGGKDDFLFGENIASKEFLADISKHRKEPVLALRNLLYPERGHITQPIAMKSIPKVLGPDCVPHENNDYCGVHILGGIPSKAVSLIVTILGWEKVGNILFNVLTERLNSNSDFADYAKHWRAECHSQLPEKECKVVNAAFEAVGL